MNTLRVNSAAGVIQAAMAQDRTAAGIACALESAQMLQGPETADELVRLRVAAETSRVNGARLIRAEKRTAELEAVLRSHRDDDQAEISRQRARVAELEALTPAPIQTCQHCGAGYTYGQACGNCEFKSRMAPVTDFFHPRRAYQRRRWLFRCLAVAPDPFSGEIRALGYLYRPGEPATATALGPDDWALGEWIEKQGNTS